MSRSRPRVSAGKTKTATGKFSRSALASTSSGRPSERGSVAATALLPRDLDEDLAVARPVELAEEDALPAAQQQLAFDDRHGFGGRPDESGAHVRPAVRMQLVVVEALRPHGQVVVPVVRALVRDPRERLVEVLEEPVLALLDKDGARRVRRVHERLAIPDAAAVDCGADVIGDVDELPRAGCGEVVVLEQVLHRNERLRLRGRTCTTRRNESRI